MLKYEKGEVFNTNNTGHEALNFLYDSDDIKTMLKKGWIEEVKETPLVDQDGRFVEEFKGNTKVWYIDPLGRIEYVLFLSVGLFNSGNCFISKEAAERFKDKQKLDVEIKRWIAKYDPDALKLDWNNAGQYKYFWKYHYPSNEINIEIYSYIKHPVDYYFSTGEKLNECLKDIGEERIKSLFIK